MPNAAAMPEEYCLLWINWWATCLTKGEWAGWVQALGAIMALGIAVWLQRLATRERNQEQYRAKFDAISSAIVLSTSIASAAMTVKKDHVLPAVAELEKARGQFAAYREALVRNPSTVPEPIDLQIHLLKLPILETPVGLLLDLVVQKISTCGQAVSAACEMKNALLALNDAITHRNLLITSMANGEVPAPLQGFLYLGERLPEGHVDHNHPDLVSAMLEYTNQLAFFGAYIAEQLMKHKTLIRSKCGPGTPEGVAVDFNEARASGLLPADSEFKEWLVGFRDEEPAKGSAQSWLSRLRSRAVSFLASKSLTTGGT